MRQYWPIRSELTMIDGTAMKGKSIIIPYQLKKQILQQLHSNNMGIENTMLLACELVYWVNMNEHLKTP